MPNQQMFNTRARVKAHYVPTPNPNHAGNPLIEALPPNQGQKDFFKAISSKIEYTENQRLHEVKDRLDYIGDIPQFFQPLPKHDELYRAFIRALRSGYTPRNPIAVDYWQEMYEKLDTQGYKLPDTKFHSIPNGFCVIGISGAGKSITLERILELFPQVIFHSQYNGQPLDLTQVVWLKLNCPHDGTIKGLVQNFFEAMDYVLEEDFSKTYGNDGRTGRTVKQMLPNMRRLAGIYHLGVLIVDEIQNLNRAGSGGTDEMLSFFTDLATTLGIPIILVGTYAAYDLLNQAFSTARRYSAQGEFNWNQITDELQWNLFGKSLWRYQYTNPPTPYADKLAKTLYDVSQGIPDLAVKIYMISQVRAILAAKESITSGLIRTVAKDHFRMAKRMIDALKEGLETGNFEELERYEDVYNRELDDAHEAYKAETQKKEKQDAKEETGDEADDTGTSDQVSAKKKVPNRKRKPSPSKDGLMAIESGPDTHKALIEAGYIKSPSEFLDDQ